MCAAHEEENARRGPAGTRDEDTFPPAPSPFSTISRARSDGGLSPGGRDEEARLGMRFGSPSSPSLSVASAHTQPTQAGLRSAIQRLRPQSTLKRRPTNVRVVSADHVRQTRNLASPSPLVLQAQSSNGGGGGLYAGHHAGGYGSLERTPLIKVGVKPDIRLTPEDGKPTMGLGRMIELGLPLIL